MALLSTLLLPAVAQYPAPVSAVWFADHKNLKRIDLGTNQVNLTVSLEHEAETLAIDPTDNVVWVLAQKKLFKFDSNGQTVLEVDLTNLIKKLDDPKHLAINPYDASLWVASEKVVLHVDAQGKQLGAWETSYEIQAMGLDVDESLWLLTHKELLHLSPQGAILQNPDLKSYIKEPEYLAVDSLGSLLWVAGKNELIQLESNHLNQAPRSVAVPNVAGGDDKKILALAVDPLIGNLWVVTKQNLIFIYDREANLLKTVDFGSRDLGETETLVFEPVGASFWLGGKKAVARFASNGDFIARIVADKEADALGVAPFRLQPTLPLLEPEDGSLTNNARPPIRLGLSTSCNAAPCFLPEAYSRSLALSVDLNGQPIGSLFSRSATEALYISPNRLPEGLNALSAQTTDLFGHISNKVTSHFTIDTIPPKFLSISPANGTTLTTAAVTLQGNLDDPTATVLLREASGNVLSTASGAVFGFAVTLKPGLNTFSLIARDPAGNETTLGLRLTYNAVSIKITSPVADASFNRTRVLVSGTFQGPENTGISVNGAVALVSGNQFLLNFDLAPGPNTLTAVATTLDGATATDAVNVSAIQTEPDPFEITVAPAMGVAPLPVRFMVNNFTGQPITRIEIDADGNGSADLIVTDLNVPIDITYPNPGVYQARVKLNYGQNQSYEQAMGVIIHDAVRMDHLFTSLWNGMNDALKQGDVEGAAQYLNEGAKAKYRPVFQALQPNMPEIIASYSAPKRISVSEDIGEYAIKRMINSQDRVYMIYFLRDANGVWRLDAM